jgi:hypothetical protein
MPAWRAGSLLMLLGLAIADAGTPACAEGGQKNDDWISPSDPQVQQRPIVDGHHVQPRPSDFDNSEFTPSQSSKVDELYRQIQQMRHREAAEARRVLRSGRD